MDKSRHSATKYLSPL